MDNKSILDLVNSSIDTVKTEERLKRCEFRKLLYKEINKYFSHEYAKLIRKMFSIEVKARTVFYSYDLDFKEIEYDETYDCPTSIKCCTYLLYSLGNLDDVKSIWNAKCIDFDSYFELDGQLLVGAGVDETIAFMQNDKDEIAELILKDVKRYKEQGAFEDLPYTKWKDNMKKYIENI